MLAFESVEGHIKELKSAEADEDIIKRMDKLAEEIDYLRGDIDIRYIPCHCGYLGPCPCDIRD